MERARDPDRLIRCGKGELAEPPRPSRLAPLLPLLLLGAVALGIAVVRARPPWLAGAALGIVLTIVVLWIVISVLWPGRAERVCPACGAEAIVRAHAGSTVGKRCSACGWRDADESAWMLAEEDGAPLEPIVLAERARRGAGPPVDTQGPPP